MRFLGLIASVLLAVGPAGSAYANWREAKSEHFAIYGDMSEKEIRQYAEKVETFDAVLRQIVGGATTTPVTIYVMDSVSDIHKMSNSDIVFGYYSADAQGANAFTSQFSLKRNDYSITSQYILFHEYAHHLTLASSNQIYPGWLSEGLAEFFATARILRSGEVVLGDAPSIRAFANASLNRWTVEDMLASENRKVEKDEIDQRYSRGWLLVHYLLLGSDRQDQLEKYVRLINQGEDEVAAGQKAFGDLKKLDQELAAYARRHSLGGLRLTPDSVKSGIKIRIRELTDAENAILPYRIRSIGEASRSDEAAGVIKDKQALAEAARGVAATYPHDAYVQRAMAEIEYDAQNWDAADVAADRALAVDPKNVMALMYKGRVQAQRAILNQNNPDLWQSARSYFLQGNRIDPNFALPFELYYDSFLAENIAPNQGAKTGLQRAAVLVPQDDGLFVRIALMWIKEGDLKNARKLLMHIKSNPHSDLGDGINAVIEKIDAKAGHDEIVKAIETAGLDKINDFTPLEELLKSRKKGKADD